MRKKTRRAAPPKFRLGTLMRLRRVSKRELAVKTKIPLPMIYRLAKGRANPNWHTVLLLARALGCSPGDFEARRKQA